jgi:hypothetical protein
MQDQLTAGHERRSPATAENLGPSDTALTQFSTGVGSDEQVLPAVRYARLDLSQDCGLPLLLCHQFYRSESQLFQFRVK